MFNRNFNYDTASSPVDVSSVDGMGERAPFIRLSNAPITVPTRVNFEEPDTYDQLVSPPMPPMPLIQVVHGWPFLLL